MSDLDADLLALADGDDSGEEGNSKLPEKKSESYTPPVESHASPPKPVTPKKKLRTGPRKTKAADSDEDVNSDDDSKIAPMSESEVDVGSPGSDDSVLYPFEGKYKDHADKAYVEGLPEIEREAIIAERKELDERKRQDNYLKRLHQRYQKEEAEGKSAKKRKAGADGDDDTRRSARKRTMVGGRKVGETSSTLEAYKARREQKNLLAEQRKAGAIDRKSRARSASDASDVDGEGESDIDWDDGRAAAQRQDEPVFEEPAELRDFQLVMVGRQHFAQVCFYPGFEDTVRNCYIRVNIGGNPATGESLYRMAKITGIRDREEKPYAIEGPNGKPFVTRQFVKCSMGKSEREFPFIFCSMTRFNEREFASYKATVTNDGLTLPRKSDLHTKIEDINALVNRSFTEKELQEKLQRSGVLKRRADANKRADLIKQRELAQRADDNELIDNLTAQIKALEPPRLAFGTSLETEADRERATRGPTEQQRLAELNKRNRKENAERVRRAQLAEKKARMELARKVERGEATGDPFARVKVLPKIHYDASDPYSQRRAGTPMSGAGGSSRGNTPTPQGSAPSGSLPPQRDRSPMPPGSGNSHLTVPKPGGVDYSQFDPLAKLTKGVAKKKEEGEAGLDAPEGADSAGGDKKEAKPSVFKRKLYDEEILAGMDFGAELDIEVL